VHVSQKLLTVKDLSSFLHVHPKTVYKWKALGKIPFVKLNREIRFERSDLDEILEKRQSKFSDLSAVLPRFELRLDDYDKMFLERRDALSKKGSRRWNYGIGAIHTKVTKQGNVRWYVDYRNETGKRIQKVVKHARSREDAVIELKSRVQEAFARRNRLRPRVKRVKFEEFQAIYQRDHSMEHKRSWKTDRSCLRSLCEFFDDFYLDEITSQHVARYKSRRLSTGVRQSTVNRDLAILWKMLNLAVEWNYLEDGQVPKIRMFSERDNIKERILTADEESRLFDASAEHLRPVLRVALHAGLRRGEILNLTWRQVDLKARMIRVEHTKSRRVRHVPVNDVLMDEFERLKRTSGQSERVFLFHNVRTAFEGACRRAGIEGLRFHDLRHTFATRLVERGVDLITVKELLGHSSVTVTERYTHSFKEQKRAAVDALSEREKSKADDRDDLLTMCETEKRDQKRGSVKSLFSVN